MAATVCTVTRTTVLSVVEMSLALALVVEVVEVDITGTEVDVASVD